MLKAKGKSRTSVKIFLTWAHWISLNLGTTTNLVEGDKTEL